MFHNFSEKTVESLLDTARTQRKRAQEKEVTTTINSNVIKILGDGEDKEL
jgi:hypothetical protein